MSIARWAFILASAGLLSACFVSKGDLIAPKDADYPIASGTTLTVWKLDEAGRRKNETPGHAVVTRDGANYVYTETGEKPVTGLMKSAGGDDFIVLFHDQDHPGQSVYGLVRRSGDNWLSYGVTCPDFAKLAKAHGKSLADFHTSDDGGNCAFTSYDDLKAAMLFLRANGKPDTEYAAGK